MSKDQVIKKTALAPTVLISNGVSYLGLKLCAALLEKGARVIVLDKVEEEIRSRAKSLLSNPNFALFNVEPEKGIPEKIKSVDYIFALNYPDDYDLHNKNLITEAFATKSLLDLAASSKAKFALVEPFFYKKSNSVYKQGFDEVTPYSYKKNSIFLRSLVRDYVDNRNLDGRIVCLPLIYGPGMPLKSSISLVRFLRAVLNNQNLVIYGDGVEEKYYLHISDAVDGILKAQFYNNTSGRIFKLISKESHADLELAFVLKGLAYSELELEYSNRPFEELAFTTSIGEDVPSWTQNLSLKKGLKTTLEDLGYDTNSYTFKPSKIIEDKLKEKEVAEKINSLLGLKSDMEKKEEEEIISKWKSSKPNLNFSLPNLPSLRDLPSFPKISLPEINWQKFVPDFSLPRLNFRSGRRNKIWELSSNMTRLLYTFTVLLFVFLLTIGLPLFSTYYSAKRGLNSLRDVSVNLSRLQTSSSQEAARDAFGYFNSSKRSFHRLYWLFSVTGQKERYEAMNSLLESVTYFSGALYRTSKAVDPFSSIWDVLRPDSPELFENSDFESGAKEFSHARNTLDIALAHYKSVDENQLPRFIRPRMGEFGLVLNSADVSLNEAQLLIGVLPEMIGVTGRKEYLLLFQNSNEVRPTGGFIGSYATLSLEEGKIKELFLDDIYNPDGQIDSRKIVSDIPAPLATFLSEDYLHIRNANWDPDFPSSAETIEDLFFKLENRTFDGVIALDLNLIQSLLDITGPVFLAAYNEEINSDNLYERTQYYSEFDYQEGISDKRSFLTVLGGKLMERIFALPPEKMPSFISQLQNSLVEKHLLISVDNPLVEEFLKEKGWDGSMIKQEGDYLMVVNANLGGTKANYFVENSYDYSITSDTRDGLLRSHLTLEYKHNGQDNSWPGGPYTDYVRIYTPKGSRLTSAFKSTDNKVPENIFENITTYDESDYTVFATSFILKPQQEIRLLVDYDLPEALSFTKEQKSYTLYWQKQPGTLNDVFFFNFKGPFGTEIVTHSPIEIQKTKNTASLSGVLNTDKTLNLILK